MMIVVMPRPAGQPISCSIETKSRSSDSPVITSGMTSGAVDMPVRSARGAEAAEAGQHIGRQRAEHHRQRRRHHRHLQADPGRAEDLRILEQRAVPLGREAAPDGDELALVEAEDDQRQDRRIEEDEAQDAEDEQQRRGARISSPPSSPAALAQQHDRHHQHHQHGDGHRARHRPVAVGEELVPEHPPDHQRVRPAEQLGDDELADRRHEDQHEARRSPPASRAAASRGRRSRAAARRGRREASSRLSSSFTRLA